jgi:triacylglycerol lipase
VNRPTRSAINLAHEGRAPGELARLLLDPVYHGAGVPRGDGRPVLVLPGLFANDLYLAPLHRWLVTVGYRPLISRIAFNAGCPDELRQPALDALRAESERHGKPAAIIGHSRGGMLGWSIAAALGAGVSHLALLGSPAPALAAAFRRGISPGTIAAAPSIARAADQSRRLLSPRCQFPACGCPYVRDMGAALHPSTRVLSVFSADDTVVPPASSQLAQGQNVAVTGSHSGLANNVAVYRALGPFLASR